MEGSIVSGFFWNLDTSKASTLTKEEVTKAEKAHLLASHVPILRKWLGKSIQDRLTTYRAAVSSGLLFVYVA